MARQEDPQVSALSLEGTATGAGDPTPLNSSQQGEVFSTRDSSGPPALPGVIQHDGERCVPTLRLPTYAPAVTQQSAGRGVQHQGQQRGRQHSLEWSSTMESGACLRCGSPLTPLLSLSSQQGEVFSTRDSSGTPRGDPARWRAVRAYAATPHLRCGSPLTPLLSLSSQQGEVFSTRDSSGTPRGDPARWRAVRAYAATPHLRCGSPLTPLLSLSSQQGEVFSTRDSSGTPRGDPARWRAVRAYAATPHLRCGSPLTPLLSLSSQQGEVFGERRSSTFLL